jgi:hypothetical protein
VTQALLRRVTVKLPLQYVRDQDRGLADRPASGAIAVQGAQAIEPHQSRNAMLAAGFTRFAQVQEHTWRSVDTLTGDERGPDQRSSLASSCARFDTGFFSHS